MDAYDPNLIGGRVAWGRSHSVYRYGNSEVIKLPLLEKIIWPNLAERLERDISVSERYLGNFFLPTRIARNPVTGQVAMVQPYIRGEYLSKKHVQTPDGKKKFEALLSAHQSMIEVGYAPLDLVGQGVVHKRQLSNVMVLSDGSFKVYDATIADLFCCAPWACVPARLIIYLVLRRQENTIRYLQASAAAF